MNPLSINIQVNKPKNIPFLDLELERIKTSFIKDEKIFYEVEFKDDPIKDSIIMNDKYLKLLWPRKLAEFLIEKINNNNGRLDSFYYSINLWLYDITSRAYFGAHSSGFTTDRKNYLSPSNIFPKKIS